MNFKFYRKVNEDGTIPGSQDIRDAVKSFFGKEIEIIIRKKTKKRTNNQNRLFWSYMDIIAFETGSNKNKIHDIVCDMFLEKEDVVFETIGEVKETIKSTKNLTTKEFAELTEKVFIWATEDLGYIMPREGQQVEIEIE